MSMKTLDELITYFTQREADCAAERDRCADFKREAQAKRCSTMWENERQVMRDTASWLKTIAKRQPVE